jgi:sarcosine oxidase / L-pipecolate oxidase
LKWSKEGKYKDIFHHTTFVAATNRDLTGAAWLNNTTAALDRLSLPWQRLNGPDHAKELHPTLTGALADNFEGYQNSQAGWADANKAMAQLRDDCIEAGVSFVCGPAGTVTGLNLDSKGRIRSLQTLVQSTIEGEHFVLAAGAWASKLVNMYNSTISTAQVLAFLPLTDTEMNSLKDMPVYINFSSGWFVFPPHQETRTLKMAVHGWGYTRRPDTAEGPQSHHVESTPPLQARREKPRFVPRDGEERLRAGLREILPQLVDRPFERTALCWYTDTPTGDFIMDFHPDHPNLFIAGGGSGQ